VYYELNVVVDDRVIVVGGMSADTNPKDYLMQYDVDKDVWKSLASMPTARYATFSFLIRDKLYVLGTVYASCVDLCDLNVCISIECSVDLQNINC